jgi:hypothetical protein
LGAGLAVAGGTALLSGGIGAIPAAIMMASGAIAGLGSGIYRGAIAKGETKSDKDLQESLEKLAISVHDGEVGADYNSIYNELTNELHVLDSEAAILA